MSRVAKNNRGFLQLLAICPAHQRQFLLRTASPQQLHAYALFQNGDRPRRSGESSMITRHQGPVLCLQMLIAHT